MMRSVSPTGPLDCRGPAADSSRSATVTLSQTSSSGLPNASNRTVNRHIIWRLVATLNGAALNVWTTQRGVHGAICDVRRFRDTACFAVMRQIMWRKCDRQFGNRQVRRAAGPARAGDTAVGGCADQGRIHLNDSHVAIDAADLVHSAELAARVPPDDVDLS